MRKFLVLLLVCCLLAVTAQADILADRAHMVETSHAFRVLNVLPLSDGGMVLAGTVTYPSEQRKASMKDVERLTKNVTEDGYAICLNADQSVRWDFYGGLEGSWNNCKVLGVMPDGRVLLSVYHVKRVGNTREQSYSYYFVDQNGNAEKDEQMTSRIEAAFDPDTLQLVSTGYIGGGMMISKPWNTEHPEGVALLDFSLQEVWRHDQTGLFDRTLLEVLEVSDGYLLFGSAIKSDYSQSKMVVRKLDQNGQEVWTHSQQVEGLAGGVNCLVILPDGSMICRGNCSPDGIRLDQYNSPIPALIKLGQDGSQRWSRYYDGEGYTQLHAALPLGDHLVMGVTTEFPNHSLLLLDMEGNIISRAAYGRTKDGILGNIPQLVQAPDGSIYAYGTIHDVKPQSSEQGGAAIGSFYLKIDEGIFQ